MSSETKIVLSGMRSTGKLHLGHLFGTLNNAVLIAPGPLQLDDEALERELLRAFRRIIIES